MKRVAIITGASSGMGRRFAETAREWGGINEIWAIARRADRLEALKESAPYPVRPIALDLTDAQKVPFLYSLLKRLKAGGKILIGDIAFKNRVEMERCRQEAGEEWDEEEFYFVADELRKAFPQLRFEKTTDCSGILTLSCREEI